MRLPPVLPVRDIHERLKEIFPEGSPNRKNCTWEIAAKTVFVMIYIGAVETQDTWLRPDQVTRMTDEQAGRTDEDSRKAWRKESQKAARVRSPGGGMPSIHANPSATTRSASDSSPTA